MPGLPTLDETKLFARVDHDDDDATLTTLLGAAIEFVQQATGNDYSVSGADVPERARTCMMALAAHWYEFREPVIVGAVTRVPMHVRSLIHQLTNWQDPSLVEATP